MSFVACPVNIAPQLRNAAATQPARSRAVVAHSARKARIMAVSTQLPPGHQNSKWPTGVPPQMGGHQMPSGIYAPISTSTTCATGLPHLFQYNEDDQADIEVQIYKNGSEGSSGLVKLVSEISAKAVAERGIFTIAISSPATALALATLSDAVRGIEFASWHVLFATEDSNGSSLAAAKEHFLSKCPVPAQQVYEINAGSNAGSMAGEYETRMKYLPPTIPRDSNGFPSLDLILLEVDALDGHVAGLFPNQSEVAVTDKSIVPVEAPYAPFERVSMTIPMMNAASNAVLMSFGAPSAGIVWRTLEVQALPGALPAQMVKPQKKLTVLLDDASASQLTPEDWTNWKKYMRSNVPKLAVPTPAKA